MHAFFRFFLISIALSTNLWASDASSSWYTQRADKQVLINVDLFFSSNCVHCHHADTFFQEIQPQYSWLRVHRYVINDDKAALIRFNQLLDGDTNFSVPSIFFCNSRWVGFATAQTTGKDLLKALEYCKQRIEKDGELTANTVNVLKRWANANKFDTSIIDAPSAPFYMLGMALIDAFNPCALFCIMAFFALLFVQDSKKARYITGLFFIAGIGLVHYMQQAYADVFFEYLFWFQLPSAVIGLVTFYFVHQQVKRHNAYSVLYLMGFLLALAVQSYQQTCLMNWSYLFEQWVHNQQMSPMQLVIYEITYQSLYLLTLILMLIAYCTLIDLDRFVKFQGRLEKIGLSTIAAIAFILAVYPYGLSSLMFSLGTIIILALYHWFKKRT